MSNNKKVYLVINQETKIIYGAFSARYKAELYRNNNEKFIIQTLKVQ